MLVVRRSDVSVNNVYCDDRIIIIERENYLEMYNSDFLSTPPGRLRYVSIYQSV